MYKYIDIYPDVLPETLEDLRIFALTFSSSLTG